MKRVKMVLYGEPGVGKSVFASKAPKPFFICTDGNYEWLEEFGADPKDHFPADTWAQVKSFLSHKESFDNYETIVLDLTEDLFKWCEQEYCTRNKIEHVSDIGYGKGYDATRNEFFIEICKLFSLDKNVILIMHGYSTVIKDRRGVEHTKYLPSSRIPDKLLDMIEGRVRYFLRCYTKDEELEDGTLLKKRYLSIVPKPNEFGIIRGIDENTIPHDIPLEWNEFAKIVGLDNKIEEKPIIIAKEIKIKKEIKKEIKEEIKPEIMDSPIAEDSNDVPWEEPKKEEKKSTTELNQEERIAAIKAKLAALKK